MTESEAVGFDALVALAVETHLDWEEAEAAADQAQRSRERAWSAVSQRGAPRGENPTLRIWRAVHQAKLARGASTTPYAAFLALVRFAAQAYLDLQAAKEHERLAAVRLSQAFAVAKAARPAGMSEGKLQGLYEAEREKILEAREL